MMPPHTPHNEAWTTKRTPFLAAAPCTAPPDQPPRRPHTEPEGPG